MLAETNGIELVGKYFPGELKKKFENNSFFLNFNLMVVNPNNVTTILRCKSEDEMAKGIAERARENDMMKIVGYLENKERENIVKVLEFSLLPKEEKYHNKVILLGKVISDPEIQQRNEREEMVTSFKIRLLSERTLRYNPYFYCRGQGEIAKEISKLIKRDYIILTTGFLQTKKVMNEEEDYIRRNTEKNFSRISLIVLQSFTFFEGDKPFRISGEVKKIDFATDKI